LAAQFARLKGRCGYKKAVVAVAHSLLVIVFHVLSRQTPYQDLGSDYFQRRDSEAHKNRLVNQLERLGFQVTVAPAA
jgi:tRNA(His) 5'-end guanylyltransferase